MRFRGAWTALLVVALLSMAPSGLACGISCQNGHESMGFMLSASYQCPMHQHRTLQNRDCAPCGQNLAVAAASAVSAFEATLSVEQANIRPLPADVATMGTFSAPSRWESPPHRRSSFHSLSVSLKI